MEYSKDIILGINYANINVEGQAKRKSVLNFIKKHKVVATISILCGILILLDCILVWNFISLLQLL